MMVTRQDHWWRPAFVLQQSLRMTVGWHTPWNTSYFRCFLATLVALDFTGG